MAELEDGDTVEVQGGSGRYTLKRLGDVYSCTCPAWLHQGATIDQRTCKHLRAYLGDDHETRRVGAAAAVPVARTGSAKKDGDAVAPPVLLAHKWEVGHDPTGWWMSEKLDGIRAYWDGDSFMSRLGNRFAAPDWFVADLPANTLDGELWVGRKMFQKTTSIVRSGAGGAGWRDVSYVVFDAPDHGGTFEERSGFAAQLLGAGRRHARWLDHARCEGIDHLRDELKRVESLGGEGLMLRRPGSRYEPGRSSSLLKVKTFHDAEAIVIGHVPGAGKHTGRLGALHAELPDGTRFNVGTGFSDAERSAPPAIGTVITFRYQELSNDGVPRFPSYVGTRVDVAWAGKPKAKAIAPSPAPARAPGSRLVREAAGLRVETRLVLEGATIRMESVETYGSDKAARRGRDQLIADLEAQGFRKR